MRVNIDKKTITKSLSKLHSMVERKNAIPILSNTKLEALNGKLSISVTDMDLYAIDSFTANILEEGAITVPIHTLFDILRKLPDNASIDITFNEEHFKDGATIKSDKMECTLPVISASEFPIFSDLEDAKGIIFDANTLRSLFIATKYAISNEETKYYLNGVFLHFLNDNNNNNIVRAVATDIHRLATAKTVVTQNCSDISGIIIPKKTINELIKLLDGINYTVTMKISTNKIILLLGDLKLSSKLIDGRFPDYAKAIAVQNDKRLDVDTKSLFDAIDLVTTISFDKTKAVKFHITHNKLILSVHNNMHGFSKAFQELEVIYDNSPIDIAFNSKYMMDMLSVFNGSKVTFSFSNSNSAVLIHDEISDAVTHVIMPMQV